MNSQKIQTTEEALAESLKCLMLEAPFEKITVKEITDGANVKRPTFYNHFRDKYEVIEYILQRDIIGPAHMLVSCDMIYEAVRLMLTGMKKDRDFYIRAVKIKGTNSFRAVLMESLKTGLLNAMNMWEMDEDHGNPLLTKDNIAEYYSLGITFVVVKWIQDGMKIEVEDVCEAIQTILSESLADIIYRHNK